MIDIKLIRSEIDFVVKKLENRNSTVDIHQVVSLDKEWREGIVELEQLLHTRNENSNKISVAIKEGQDVTKLKESMKHNKARIEELELIVKDKHSELNSYLAKIPNLPEDEVPNSPSEDDNKEISKHGTIPTFDFEPKEHFIIGEELGLLDFEIAVKMAGTRFAILKGDLAKLSRALSNFMLDSHTKNYGYQEIEPPILLLEDAMFNSAQLPKFKEDLYETKDNHYLIPSSETSLVNACNLDNLKHDNLPLRLTANTPCFRKESGSAGRDTRGLMRLHQFGKVELVSVTDENSSDLELKRMTKAVTSILDDLEIPYRVIVLTRGDMGFSAQKTYDVEVFLPGQNKYREISSCSNCGDFQARRMNLKYSNEENKKVFCHSLNGSGLAIGRTIIAIMENYQNKDGSITIPQKLIPYFGAKKIEKSGN